MSTYVINGSLPQSARYIGEYVAADDTVQYFYRVVAYDRNSTHITDIAAAPVPNAFGPQTLDGNHCISVSWTTVIGASYYLVYKGIGSAPAENINNPWWSASFTETEILDVGYPCSTRNSWLNPGVSPIYPAGCCGPGNPPVDTNVPPAGTALPDDGHEGGGYVRTQGAVLVTTIAAGLEGSVQFNEGGMLAGDASNLFWDNLNKRLGIRNQVPKYPLDVND